ncbi:TetR/AcrR family transcriptional regulator [Pseudonocardia humida]|uniref:TetR/AcrR family transcriptional regulator n=1 Tax=Pseudonocardia humida TaxID=2800819 RepID=A0ABT1A6U2_9PSEU|nr:TetR/AcrR family transcriptional regulator [Pseudonocardia humida]MCO1658544.1 TetR/AcrR family transcriptional regulator [Pseudonocardia humida]
MPKLWDQTIEGHRQSVRNAILDTTAALVAEHGLLSVTMSRIAEGAGVGRATLYKYFPDVEAVLLAWHERQIAGHLAHLSAVGDQVDDPTRRLEAVLTAFGAVAHETHRHHGSELAAVLHRDPRVARAQRHLHDMVRDLLVDASATGDIRDDVVPDELASYCLHALAAAATLPSGAAVRRLVEVTLDGLRPPR